MFNLNGGYNNSMPQDVPNLNENICKYLGHFLREIRQAYRLRTIDSQSKFAYDGPKSGLLAIILNISYTTNKFGWSLIPRSIKNNRSASFLRVKLILNLIGT